MLSKLASMIGFGKVTSPGADNKAYSIQQVTYDGKAANVFVVFPYGMHGNLPADVLSVLLAVEADPANRVAIGAFSKGRPTMEGGEVCFYHPPTGSILHFKKTGALEITTGTQAVTINCSTATVNGNATINGDATVNGDATINGSGTITGDLDVTGDVNCANVTATTEVTAGAVNLTTHTHPYSWTLAAGSSNTGTGTG